MSYELKDPPCKTDDVINFNFNLDNLDKFLNFLLLSDKEIFTRLNELGGKINQIDDLKSQIKENNNQLIYFQEKFKETDKVINTFNNKFTEIDSKFQNTCQKLLDLDEKNKALIKKEKLHDDQIECLSRNSNDNYNEIQKISDLSEKMRRSQEAISEKVDRSEKLILKLTNDMQKVNEVESNVKKNKNLLDNLLKDYQDFEYTTNKKFSEMESNLLTLVSSVSEIDRIKSTNTAPNTAHISQISNNEELIANNAQVIKQVNKEIDNLRKLNRDFSEKVEKISKENLIKDNLINEVNKKLSNLDDSTKKSIEELTEEFKIFTEKKEDNVDSDKLKPEQQIEIIFDQLHKFQDAIKSTTLMLHQKLSRDDAEKITRINNSEIDKLALKVSDMFKNNDTKVNKICEKFVEINSLVNKIMEKYSGNSGNIDQGKLNENILSAINDYLDKNFTRKINDMYKSGEFEIPEIKEFLLKMEEKKNELINILKTKGNSNRSEEKEEEFNNLETKLNKFCVKLNNLDDLFVKSKIQNEEKFKNIEGDGNFMDDISLQNEINPNMNVFEAIKYNCITINNETKRIEKIAFNVENLNTEILNKVKKDLKHESVKVLDDFKIDLKISIGKIEDELRKKVDLLSLDEFGKQVDNKLNSEFNKKLDRQDLKKNNNLINKKIDTLENKISKTLVDTLIDLQHEDQPLLVKKSMTGNGKRKCASCNQYLNQGKERPETCIDDECRNISNNNLTKYKFRSIQDNSNKYGTGSYSRHLSNIDGEDLRRNKNVHYLPEIPEKSGNIKNRTGNSFYKIKINEGTEKRFNSMIEEELEKSLVNPDNFIKNANKIHDNAEKKYVKKENK